MLQTRLGLALSSARLPLHVRYTPPAPSALASSSSRTRPTITISPPRHLQLQRHSRTFFTFRFRRAQVQRGLATDAAVNVNTGSTSQSHQQQYQNQENASGKRSGSSLGRWMFRLVIALSLPAVYFLGAAFPPQLVLLLMPRHAPPPPDKDDPRGQAMMNEVEAEAQNLPVVERMRAKEDWYETRPYQRFDPNKVHNSLTAGSLRGPGRLAIPPILFAKDDESEAMAVIHLGRALCGHDGIIHGGLISTVFDESLARNALLNLPSNIGVTASLTVNFKSPCQADQFVIVRTKLGKVNGRKVTVSGTMETLDGERIAEANALFIEPKWAQFLQSSGVTEALGRPLPKPSASPAMMDGETERII